MAQPNMGTPPVDIKLKEGLQPKPETMLRLFCEKFFKNKLAVAGSVILLVIIFSAIFAPVIAPYTPEQQDLFQAAPAAKCRAFYGH
ncbi:peptide ABC transporter permease [Bacillus safensis FO-36b] [Bacillus safensis subsp. safensis]